MHPHGSKKRLHTKYKPYGRLLATCLLAFSSYLQAETMATLNVVEIASSNEEMLGEATAASAGTVSAKQLENRPLLRPAEVLEMVPGLMISQHSGDGKANQYYLRGFNLDHGTDFATSLLGMPINLPSHAHGQGYSDLQFLIPELIERMNYRKGPYGADVGDFASAGSASIDYFRKLDHSFADITAGEHDYYRGLITGSQQLGQGNFLYALEWMQNDGPWVHSENLNKLNAVLRYSMGTKDNGWSVTALAYQARWSSTDQVPQRAIDSGLISRFDSLDPSDGGRTHRASVSGEWSQRQNNSWTRANVYIVDYGLNLWSNFTYCLNDIALSGNCNRGDQFEQVDRRQIYGANAAHTWYGDMLGKSVDITFGMQSRFDGIGKVGLYTTTDRNRWNAVRVDKIQEGTLGLYGEGQIQWHEKFRSIVGLRGDFFNFDVHSSLPANSGTASDHIFSPKLSLIFGPWSKTEFYANYGYGFHSNDARGITTKVNPDFRDPDYLTPVRASDPLVRTRGYEVGLRSYAIPKLQTTLALWQLNLASELVFAGDAGTTEQSFPSRRYGVEWANTWTPTSLIVVDADFAISRARYTEIDSTIPGNYVPGAIDKTASIGVTYDDQADWSAAMRLRYLGPRALIEDNSVRSKGSTLVNFRLAYKFDKRTSLALDVLNAFDRKVSDIDYYYESQLRGEAASVNDIHTHPAEPRSFRLSLRFGF